jgi:hypothetical protein
MAGIFYRREAEASYRGRDVSVLPVLAAATICIGVGTPRSGKPSLPKDRTSRGRQGC